MVTSPDDRLEVDFRVHLAKDQIQLLSKAFVGKESVEVETVDGLTFEVQHNPGHKDEKPYVTVRVGKESRMFFFVRGDDVTQLRTSLFHLFREQ